MRGLQFNPVRNWFVLVAWACLVAQLSLASAALWHHHDDADGRHDDCAVCVAVSADRTDGLPPLAFTLPPLQRIGFLAEPAPTVLATRTPRHAFARGPPKA